MNCLNFGIWRLIHWPRVEWVPSGISLSLGRNRLQIRGNDFHLIRIEVRVRKIGRLVIIKNDCIIFRLRSSSFFNITFGIQIKFKISFSVYPFFPQLQILLARGGWSHKTLLPWGLTSLWIFVQRIQHAWIVELCSTAHILFVFHWHLLFLL